MCILKGLRGFIVYVAAKKGCWPEGLFMFGIASLAPRHPCSDSILKFSSGCCSIFSWSECNTPGLFFIELAAGYPQLRLVTTNVADGAMVPKEQTSNQTSKTQ